MARFREVELWPGGGHVDQSWTDDPATDALVKSACRVCEAYSQELAEEALTAPYGSLRVFPHLVRDGREHVILEVNTGRPDGYESAVVLVPPAVASLSSAARARIVLDVLHESLLQLAPHRGWPVDALERVRMRVLDSGASFEWTSPWKSSPNRVMEARAVFRLADDGFGRVAVEVRDRRSCGLVARSEPAVTSSGPSGFRHVTQTLRWRGATVELIPMVFSVGKEHFGDVLTLDPATDGIAGLPPLDDQIADAPVLPIALAPYGVIEDDPTPGVNVFLILDLGQSTRYRDQRMETASSDFTPRLARELFERTGVPGSPVAEWLDGRAIEVTLRYETADAWGPGTTRYGITIRRMATKLIVKIVRPADVLNDPQVSAETLGAEVDRLVVELMSRIRERAAR